MRKQAIFGGLGFGMLIAIAYFLIGFSPVVAILAGLGAGFLFCLGVFITATAQARKKRSWDQADTRANRDTVLQLIFGSVVTIASISYAIGGNKPNVGLWIFVSFLGLATVMMGLGSMMERYGRRKIGEVLIEAGVITEEELNRALEEQQKRRIGEILIEAGAITEEELNRALEEQQKKLGRKG